MSRSVLSFRRLNSGHDRFCFNLKNKKISSSQPPNFCLLNAKFSQKSLLLSNNETTNDSTAADIIDSPYLFKLDDVSASDHKPKIEFKFGEFVACRIVEPFASRHYSQCVNQRMFKLLPGHIFRFRNFEIFHENILNLKSLGFLNTRFEFKRPSLYEYIALKEQRAVSSHYSILSLVPLLLELGVGSRVLECGTGSGSMTLFLSQQLGQSGLLHTFDLNPNGQLANSRHFQDWKNSYDLRSDVDKWPSNVKFGAMDFNADETLCTRFSEFYDAIYLDLVDLEHAVIKAYKLLRPGGILVINSMQLTQVIKCLNALNQKGISGFEKELVIEPSNRLWEVEKVIRRRDMSQDDNLNEGLHWTLRLEDRFNEKYKRGGLFFNYWQGYLTKFRKIK